MAAGFNPTEFVRVDGEYSLRNVEDKFDPKYRIIINKIQNIQKYKWKATLVDGTKISEMSDDDLFLLPNVAGEKIKEIHFGNSDQNSSLDFWFSNEILNPSVYVAISGSVEVVQKIGNDVKIRLKQFSRKWWLLRDQWIIFLVSALFCIYSLVDSIADLRSGKNDNNPPLVFLIFAIPAALSILYLFVRLWHWVFPMLEIRIGASEDRNSASAQFRNAVFYTIPVAIAAKIIIGIFLHAK